MLCIEYYFRKRFSTVLPHSFKSLKRHEEMLVLPMPSFILSRRHFNFLSKPRDLTHMTWPLQVELWHFHDLIIHDGIEFYVTIVARIRCTVHVLENFISEQLGKNKHVSVLAVKLRHRSNKENNRILALGCVKVKCFFWSYYYKHINIIKWRKKTGFMVRILTLETNVSQYVKTGHVNVFNRDFFVHFYWNGLNQFNSFSCF